MENSIENIWKNGDHGNVKHIDFYNRESKLWFQKIIKYLKKDNFSLIPIGVMMAGLLIFYKEYVGAILAFGFIFFLYLLNRNTIAKLKNINPSEDVGHYMKTNQLFIKNQKRFYTIFTSMVIPLFIVVELWVIFHDAEIYLNTITEISVIKKVILAGLIYTSIAVISLFSYLTSTKVIYGQLLKKLDQIVEDLESEEK